MSDRARTRRSSEEVRALIVAAAVEEFSANGFADATTRGIAAAAGISLSVLHKQFPTKERLFSAALLDPFLSAFYDFEATWPGQLGHPWDDEARLREFIAGLYDHIKSHRATLVNLLAISSKADNATAAEVLALVADTRTRLALGSSSAPEPEDLDAEMTAHAIRMIAALVTGLVLLQPFFTHDDPEAEDTMMIELTARAALRAVTAGPRRRGG